METKTKNTSKQIKHRTHQFWVMDDGNKVMSDRKLQIQTAPKKLMWTYDINLSW